MPANLVELNREIISRIEQTALKKDKDKEKLIILGMNCQ
jgi:hypothetical protein